MEEPAAGAGREPRKVQIEVPPEAAGQRLDVFLAQRGGVGGRAAIKELARAGGILLDGMPAKAGHGVHPGQVVTVDLSAVPSPAAAAEPAAIPVPTTFGVLYEDAHVVVVDKPAGLSVHRPEGRRGEGSVNLADLAADRFGVAERGLLGRGYAVSGCSRASGPGKLPAAISLGIRCAQLLRIRKRGI